MYGERLANVESVDTFINENKIMENVEALLNKYLLQCKLLPGVMKH